MHIHLTWINISMSMNITNNVSNDDDGNNENLTQCIERQLVHESEIYRAN